VINSGSSTTTVSGTKIETGNIRFSGNRLDSLAGDLNINSATGVINLTNNTSISSNLSIRDNFSFDGTLNLSGDQVTDRVTFNVELEQNFNPNETSEFTLGSNEKPWLTTYLDRLEVGDISIYDNVIETNKSNADLDLRANGTGKISTVDNIAIDNNALVLGLTNFKNVSIDGNYTITGNVSQTGSLNSNILTVGQNLNIGASATFEEVAINGNIVETVSSNTNLELRASGSGIVLVPVDNIRINNNLFANNTQGNTAVISLQTEFDTALVSDVRVSENYINANATNANLELRANGTGKVVIQESARIDNDLDVYGTTTLKNSTFAQVFGPQLVVNGTFDTNIAGWTSTGGGTTTRDPLGYIVVEAITGARITSQNITLVPGALYQFSATIISRTLFPGTPDYSLRVFESGVGDRLSWTRSTIEADGGAPQVLSGSFIAATTSVTIAIRSANASVKWDNFSIIRDFGIVETITPNNVLVTGVVNQLGNTVQTGDVELSGDLTVDGAVTVDSKTDFINYTIDGNVLRNRRFGLSLNTTDPFNPLGFYNIVLAMANGATEDDYLNQTEKNLINFLANGSSAEDDYAFSYADVNQNGNTTLGDALFWLQFIANGTANDEVIDDLIRTTINELIEIEFNNPGTFNKEILLFGDYFEPDFILESNGSGNISFPSNDVRIEEDLSANTIIVDRDITVDETILFNRAVIRDNVAIENNVITTEVSNADLELRATGNIVVASNDVLINENLSNNDVVYLDNLNVSGTVQVTGNTSQIGNLDVLGNLTVLSLTSDDTLNFRSISTAGNVLSTINSNEDLELRANGVGTVYVSRNNVLISNDLDVNLLATNNITINDTVAASQLNASSDILIFDNVITTTTSNSNLELKTVNSKSVVLENLQFNQNNLSSPQDINISASSTLVVLASGSLRIPRGTTAQRNISTGSLRFNSTDNVFEGFNNNTAITFNGIYSSNRRTSILAHPTNDTINFTVNQGLVGSITDSGLVINSLLINDTSVSSNIIRTTVSNADLELGTNGTGELVIGDISIVDGTIKNNSAGALTFENTNFGIVKFAANNALAIPFGTTEEQPLSPEPGTTRWNTSVEVLEVWDGTTFITAAGQSATISSEEFQNLMLEYTLIFG
jgi:cytoskeletal protein CcmA (bactofilin family)